MSATIFPDQHLLENEPPPRPQLFNSRSFGKRRPEIKDQDVGGQTGEGQGNPPLPRQVRRVR